MSLLFEKNFEYFVNAVGKQIADNLDFDYINQKLNSSSPQEDYDSWIASDKKAIRFADIIPRNQRLFEHYKKEIDRYSFGDSISQYINDHECDSHLFSFINQARECIKECDFDPDYSVSTDIMDHRLLIVVDTGDGIALNTIINKYNPENIAIAVNRWEDLVSSFNNIDWMQLTTEYRSNPDSLFGIYISRVDDAVSLVDYLKEQAVALLEHSLVYYPKIFSEKTANIVDRLISSKTTSIVNYAGFIQDEYNMVLTSAEKLSHGVKVFSSPIEGINLSNIVVCASGPSLDESIDMLRVLQKDHVIIASASSYGTLKENNIRVDVCVILERGYFVYDDYKSVVGTVDDHCILLDAIVADYRLRQLFPKNVTYYRSALTPFSLFSKSDDQALPLDGPQAVNSAVSFASSLRPSSILLVGVDLGTFNIDKPRSESAAGVSPRTFSRTAPANLNPELEVHTDGFMLDGKWVLELIKGQALPSVAFYNASNGLKVEGYEPIHSLQQYYELNESKITAGYKNDLKVLDFWLNTCTSYNSDDFYAIWSAGGQRSSIHNVCSKIKALMQKDKDTISTKDYAQITDILSVEKNSKRNQFAIRILRGYFHKIFISIRRQEIIMYSDPDKRKIFITKIKAILIKEIDNFEREMYQLCDLLEETLGINDSHFNQPLT